MRGLAWRCLKGVGAANNADAVRTEPKRDLQVEDMGHGTWVLLVENRS